MLHDFNNTPWFNSVSGHHISKNLATRNFPPRFSLNSPVSPWPIQGQRRVLAMSQPFRLVSFLKKGGLLARLRSRLSNSLISPAVLGFLILFNAREMLLADGPGYARSWPPVATSISTLDFLLSRFVWPRRRSGKLSIAKKVDSTVRSSFAELNYPSALSRPELPGI